ncbi:MAG: SsrA-binding protein SmpB [Dehalococcoidia bacterium]
MKTITVNRKARFDYHILETIEAGLVLTGTEIKSIRAGKVNIRDAFSRPEDGELWLFNAHIAQYSGGNRYNHEPTRPRKLLLHRDEIRRFAGKVEEKGLALIPLRLYIKDHRAKMELALAKGKKLYDKRRSIAKKDADRQIQRMIRRKVGPRSF